MGSRFIKIIVLVLISYGFFSCQSETPQKLFDYGKVENGIYSNEYFGFSVQIPDKWVVQSREQQEGLMEASEKIVTGDDKYMKAVYDAAKVN
ncbi:MAG: hypothetical protein C0599_00325 [Salinivirgaceae bacterium]|nr:MAG: hypothetical protein C0599_00325 [Salinivirgaceae bacterium]